MILCDNPLGYNFQYKPLNEAWARNLFGNGDPYNKKDPIGDNFADLMLIATDCISASMFWYSWS